MEYFGNQFVICLGRFCSGTIAKNVLLLEMGVTNINIAGNNGMKHFSGIGLPQNLEAGCGVNRGVTHRKEKAQDVKLWIIVLAHLVNGFTNLNNTIKLKIAGTDNHNHFVRGSKSIESQPREGR